MPSIAEIYAHFERRLPLCDRMPWDNDGLMVCADLSDPVDTVLTAVDVTPQTIAKAKECGAQLLLTHHPLLFHPAKSITPQGVASRQVIALLEAGISVLSYHTRLDAAAGGINDLLAQRLGLDAVRAFGPEGETLGRIGSVKEMPFSAFCTQVKKVFGTAVLRYVAPRAHVARVAVLGGSGKDFFAAAAAAGADVFLTGEMSYDAMLDAQALGMNAVEAGHFETERVCCAFFEKELRAAFPQLRVIASDLPAPLCFC